MGRLSIGRRSFVSAAALSVTGLVVTGVRAQDKLVKSRVAIAVGSRASFHFLPLMVAQRLGYFAAEGLEVEIHDFGGGLRALRAVQDGSDEIVGSGFDDLISLQARGQFYRAFVLLSRAPQIAFGVSARAMPGYKKVADLRGRKIGVPMPGASANMVASLVLARGGVLPTEVSFVEMATPAAAILAVRSGQVDAMSYTEPVMSILEQKGEVRIVSDTRTLKGTQEIFGGPMVAACLYASLGYVQNHPQTTQALTNAVVHALKWLQTAGPSDLIKVVPDAHLHGDRAVYLGAFNKIREGISVDGVMPDEGVRTALRAVGRVDRSIQSDKIDMARLFTNEFSRRAKEKFKA